LLLPHLRLAGERGGAHHVEDPARVPQVPRGGVRVAAGVRVQLGRGEQRHTLKVGDRTVDEVEVCVLDVHETRLRLTHRETSEFYALFCRSTEITVRRRARDRV